MPFPKLDLYRWPCSNHTQGRDFQVILPEVKSAPVPFGGRAVRRWLCSMIGRMQRGLEGPLQSLTPIMGRSHWGKGPLWGEAALPGEGPLGEGANGQEPLGEGKLEKKPLDRIFFLSELALSAAYSLPTTPPTSEGTDQRQRQGTPHNHPYAASYC